MVSETHINHQKRAAVHSDAAPPEQKKRKGFSVGPANLPDGTYRRKVQKIKADLIHKAKVRKAYAKLKEKEPGLLATHFPPEDSENKTSSNDDKAGAPGVSSEGPKIHPDRQAKIDQLNNPSKPVAEEGRERGERYRRRRNPKPNAFAKELAAARRREEEVKRRQKEAEDKRRDREAMAKAKRPDQFGNRRLGRESGVLLERVKRMAGN